MKIAAFIPNLLAGIILTLPFASAYIPDASGGSLDLMDAATGIGGIRTIFVGDSTVVTLSDIAWSMSEGNSTSSTMVWETSVNGEVKASGVVELDGVDPDDLPTSIDAGSIVVDKTQLSTVEVSVSMEGGEPTSASGDYQTYGKGAAIAPLIVIILLALTTQMVELSLFSGIWLGASIITGSLADGFTTTIVEFLTGALANEGHVMVILFTMFLAGTVGMMQKSGGMLGFTNLISKYATTPRAGQFACIIVGIIIFFDDYANLLMTGEMMRPLLDVLFVSREKLSFIVDATAAPIASISPVSSWVGYEAGLVQDAIDVLLETNSELTIATSGFAVFLQSLRYSYYSLFMIGLIAMLIATQRDYGPMLIAERKVRVYERTDGGDGAAKGGKMEGTAHLAPKEDQPLLAFNMLIPILVLVIMVFWILVNTGSTGEPGQSFMSKIEGGDSYIALLYGTLGTAFVTIIFYLVQFTVPGTSALAMPTPANLKGLLSFSKAEDAPRFLMTLNDSIEAFLYGMARIFLAIVVLTLAWGCGSVMTAVGADRLFSSAIVGGGIPPEILPTLTFVIALLMALATGTSWGTMSILFPLLLVPTYEASDGNPEIFYATVSAVLGGAVAGDHCSPISDTTILASLACDTQLMAHVNTQAPYALWVIIFAILVGYIPMGYGAFPNIIGILLGWVCCALFVFFICVPVMSPTGRYDILTTLCCGKSTELQELAADCVKKVEGEAPKEAAGEEAADEEAAEVEKDA